ncbi:hypothetical protein Ccrd_002052 [Cynara cardunculus var. scolymus]|uniref:Uncharacterized protein n=1 Tax=Cynara cardunculus var. scolymus TaxID=59895 RepID=A0A103XS38_CYNCS|nr:hypothetical protein Ccrd_002052 [Cynara cardunculus var. scolymus]
MFSFVSCLLGSTKMAIISDFFSCFSASNKVVDEGNQKVGASRKAHNVDDKNEAKRKGGKNAPIPLAYFPIGSNFSRFCFSALNKVVDEGNEKVGNEEFGESRKAQNIDSDKEAKSKSRKSAAIPVAYFSVGSNFSRL